MCAIGPLARAGLRQPHVSMVSPAGHLAPLTARAQVKSVTDMLVAEQQAQHKQKSVRGELFDESQPAVKRTRKGSKQRAKQRNSAACTSGEQPAGTAETSNEREIGNGLPAHLSC